MKFEKNYVLYPLIVFVFCIVLLGLFYPLVLRGFGYLSYNNAEGSPIIINNTIIGSKLIAGYINNSALFWPNYNNSFSIGYDPYITVNQALSQVNRISNATGIPKSVLIDIIYQNSRQIEMQNLYIFSPNEKIVNVMQLNEILIKMYPNIYSKLLGEK